MKTGRVQTAAVCSVTLAALLAVGCQEPSSAPQGQLGPDDATVSADAADTSAPNGDDAFGDAGTAPAADPCPTTVEQCPEGQVIHAGALASGAKFSLCVPAFPDCTTSQVPDGEGGCEEVAPPCALGALDGEGGCIYAKPDCEEGETVVAGACLVLAPDLSCPPDAVDFPEPPVGAKAWYVKAGAPEGGDGSQEHPFPTPAKALGVATKGSALLLGEGEYAAFNILKDDMTVRGLCAARTRVVSATKGKMAIGVAGSGVTIETLGVSGLDAGIWVDGASDVTIRGVDASASTITGIGLSSVNGAHLTDIHVEDVQAGQGKRVGIMVQGSTSVTVERVLVSGVAGPGAAGVGIVASGQVALSNVRIEGLTDGVTAENITGDIAMTGSLLVGQSHAGVQVGPPGSKPGRTLTIAGSEITGQGPDGTASNVVGIVSFPVDLTVEVTASYLHHLAGGGIGMEAGAAVHVSGSRFDENWPNDLQLRPTSGALDIQIRDSAFTSLSDGVVAANAGVGEVLVEGCRFTSSPWAAPPDDPTKGMTAVVLEEVPTATIRGCVFGPGLASGSIRMQPAWNATIEGNVFVESPQAAIDYSGVGITAETDGGVLIARNHIQGAHQFGITLNEPPATILRDNLVRDTVRKGDDRNAAIEVFAVGAPSQPVLLERNTVIGGGAPGIGLDGGAELRDNVVLDVREAGIHLQLGSYMAERNVVAGVAVQEVTTGDDTMETIGRGFDITGASVTLSHNGIAFAGTDGIVLSFASEKVAAPSHLQENRVEGNAGDGVFVQAGGNGGLIELSGNEIACNHGSGVTVLDSNLSSDGDIIRDTRFDAFKVFANNVNVAGESKVTLEGTKLWDAEGAGVDVSSLSTGSSVVELVGAQVLRNRRGGIDLHQGVSATVGSGTVLRGNGGAGVFVRGATLSLVGATIEDTVPVEDTGEYGDGVQAVLEGKVTCKDTRIQSCARAGLLVDASSAALAGCTLDANGYGIVSQAESTVQVDATEVTGSLLSDVFEPSPGEELEADERP